MKSVKVFLAAFLLVGFTGLLAGLVGCSGQNESAPSGTPAPGTPKAAAAKSTAAPAKTVDVSKIQIAVIPKGTAHPFWKTVHAGAAKAAAELGLKKENLIWMGTENENDRSAQVTLVNNFISRQVSAIVLAPLDDKALVSPVEEALKSDIPVVIIDSGLKSDKINSFVATDNVEGGRLGARRLGELMGGKGKAILMRYAVGSDSTTKREEGFLEELKAKFPNIQLISDNQYAGTTKETAMQTADNLLNKFPDVEGIFCPNESSAYGMLRSLQTSGKAGKIKFVGFDATADLLDALKKGEIQGLVVQDPLDIGYQGVKAAYEVIQGKPVKARIPTRLEMVTPENMEKLKDLTSPDIDKWLK